ncbi:MAG: flagellar export chaperone FlgN [Thermoleophilia bacterium]|nr:flagellar export chaperone FlgN [Thermoleophilia bacterium]
MRERVTELASCLDELIEIQERLVAGVIRQREAIGLGEQDRIREAAADMEQDVLRLGALESRRNVIAAELADELGCVAARWSVIRERLDDRERAAVGRRVASVERLVRELELQNAVNSQLVRTELELVDLSIRSIAATDPRALTRAYAPGGRVPDPAPAGPMLLNLAA